MLAVLPKGDVFDGEIVVLDDAGRPQFDKLLFGRGRPTYVAFDLLMADGVDLRPLSLRERKVKLADIGKGAEAGSPSRMDSSARAAPFIGPWSRPTLRASSPSD